MTNWIKEFEKVKKCPQRQDSLRKQLEDLYQIANRFGLYDAADMIRKQLEKE